MLFIYYNIDTYQFIARWYILSVNLFQHLLHATDIQRVRENNNAIIRCTHVYIPIKFNLFSTFNSFISFIFVVPFDIRTLCRKRGKKWTVIIFIVHFLFCEHRKRKYFKINSEKYVLIVLFV